MSAFRVGDKVKRIAEGNNPEQYGYVGWCGVVEGINTQDQHSGLDVRYDNGQLAVGCAPNRFAPLTPPDESANKMVKQVTKPMHVEPVAPKVTV